MNLKNVFNEAISDEQVEKFLIDLGNGKFDSFFGNNRKQKEEEPNDQEAI